MKLLLATLAALPAVTLAQTACNVSAIIPLAKNPEVTQCSADSAFSFVPPTVPSAAVVAKMCESEACMAALSAIEALDLGDCLLLGSLYLETDLLGPIKSRCSGSGGSGSAISDEVGSDSSTTSSDSAPSVETPTPTPTPTPTSSAVPLTISLGVVSAVAVAATLF